jgi:hypothetical protein
MLKWNATAASALRTRQFCGEADAGSISAGGLIGCARHRNRISQYRKETEERHDRWDALHARPPCPLGHLRLGQAAPLAASPTGVLTGAEV